MVVPPATLERPTGYPLPTLPGWVGEQAALTARWKRANPNGTASLSPTPCIAALTPPYCSSGETFPTRKVTNGLQPAFELHF